jgi:hypothetical protein
MPRKLSRPRDGPEQQSKRFIETARELGCDEDEAAFDKKLRQIATVKPKPKTAPNGKRARRSRTQPDQERD